MEPDLAAMRQAVWAATVRADQQEERDRKQKRQKEREIERERKGNVKKKKNGQTARE